jgi:uroporphyrinogen-III synthase
MALCALIEAYGGIPRAFPVLEIAAPTAPEPARKALCAPADLVIFISPNAVSYASQLLGEYSLPKNARLAAVGSGTAQALARAGLKVDLQPTKRFDSEGLLALPELAQVTGQRILIVRGEGGRALLGDTLRARGAEVGYAEVYRRCRSATDPKPVLQTWRQEVDLVTTTSIDILLNLKSMLGEAGWPLLSHTPLLVISERMRGQAQQLGWRRILLAQGASNESIVARLCNWVKSGE